MTDYRPKQAEEADPKAPLDAVPENEAGDEAATSDRARGVGGLLKRTVSEFADDDCMAMAASLSYYTVFSLPPLVFLIVFLVGLFVQHSTVEQEILRQVNELIGPSAAEQVKTMLDRTAEQTTGAGASLWIGFGALLFAATAVFAQLQTALNRTWGVAPDPERGGLRNFLGKRLLSLGMVLALGFLLLVSLALSAILSAMGAHFGYLLPAGLSEGVLRLLNSAFSFMVFALLFAAIFKWLPDAVIRWRDVWAGAAGTALLFVIGKMAIGLYLGRSNPGEAFGAAGALAIIMLWVYYTSIVLLLGAEFTQVWARSYGSRIRPEPSAVRVIRRYEQVK
ncbi:MAG: YihY/virulence factor BrkB family protein [Bryobacteraceae bacterium]|nr:YihY/virulence factor BrkB family protein [Bryobacteraceae bacterium]